ncbi:hypothetical protein [Aurantiacibacter sp. MUD61]|uniref:hypothetical protein n=1 Tax=Aurantiacibacter sp. MUD61 TaxID=3009083 RepID=UPI0022F042EF|nr:hypothetical protein [Aurantiacibacter sp. MUD61]
MDEMRSSTSSREEFMAAVSSAIEDGTLTPPAAGTTGYLWRGAADTWGLAPEALEGEGWQIVFTPFATGSDLNLLEEPDGTMPWVMAGGTPFAHIMVFGSAE